MNEDLRALVEADEEARARIDAARAGAEKQLAEAQAAAEQARREHEESENARLEEQVRMILEGARREVAARRERRSAYLAERRQRAESLLSTAVGFWVRLIREGPVPARRP